MKVKKKLVKKIENKTNCHYKLVIVEIKNQKIELEIQVVIRLIKVQKEQKVAKL